MGEVSAERVKKTRGGPSRISLSAIGRDIGQLSLLQQHLDKLPKTAEVLKGLIESREEYAVRRIRWALPDCMRNNSHPARWLLIKKAGVVRLAEQPEVKDAIDQALHLLQPSPAACNDCSFAQGAFLQEFNQ